MARCLPGSCEGSALKRGVSLRLTPAGRQAALREAARRQAENERNGLQGRNGGEATGAKALKLHELGALGEAAVAEYLGLSDGLFCESAPVRGRADLPRNIEVKTRSRHWHDLIIQGDEEPSKLVVLVTIQGGRILMHGWCRAGAVMREEYWSDPAGGRPAYFVPKHALLPPSKLKDILQPTRKGSS